MGRRNEHSAAEFDSLVLSQIESFLADQPAQALSMRKVANMINYAPSTLVSVYGSYAQLLLRVNARTLEKLNQQLSACLAPTLTNNSSAQVKNKLAQLALTYFTFAQQNPHLWQLVFELRMPDDNPLPPWFQSAIDHSFELLQCCLSQLGSETTAEQQQLASKVLWAGVHGITQLALGDKLFLNQHTDGTTLIHSLLDNYLATWLTSPTLTDCP